MLQLYMPMPIPKSVNGDYAVNRLAADVTVRVFLYSDKGESGMKSE